MVPSNSNESVSLWFYFRDLQKFSEIVMAITVIPMIEISHIVPYNCWESYAGILKNQKSLK